MKKIFLTIVVYLPALIIWSQPDQIKYPVPEFSNEVYWLQKDSNKVVRLEKTTSKMDTKTKMGGMGGAENGYSVDGERSSIRLKNGNNLSFVFSTGTASAQSSNPAADSTMRANGLDPAMMQGMGSMTDPSNSITLYKAESGKGDRKVLLMKTPGMLPFGSKKIRSSDKMGFSVKKIKEGYWELVIDKKLSSGEYVFVMTNMSAMGMATGGATLFAFAVD